MRRGHVGVEHAAAGLPGHGRLYAPFLAPRFVTHCVMNLACEEVGVGEVEQPHVAQIGRCISATDIGPEPGE
jgi:hypothetical protein